MLLSPDGAMDLANRVLPAVMADFVVLRFRPATPNVHPHVVWALSLSFIHHVCSC